MSKAVKLAVRQRLGSWEVVGRVHSKETRERFELPSDKVRRRFGNKDDAIRWAADVETYTAGLGLKRNLRETSLTPVQLREAETAFGLLEGEGIRLTDCVREYLASGAGVRKHRLLKLKVLETDFLDVLDRVHALSPRSLEDKKNRLCSFRTVTGAKTVQDFSVAKIELVL